MTSRQRTSTLLAGWLFADLLLGLTIIMLGAQAPSPSPTRTPVDAARPRPDTAHPSPRPDTAHPSPRPDTAHPSSDTARPSPENTRPSPETVRSPAEESPASARPRPSPSPSATPSTCVGGVRAKPVTLSFRVVPGADDDALATQVRQELHKHRDRLTGRHAGMVLTFGADGGAGNGVRLATRVNTAIRAAYPRIFGTAVTRNFHDLAAPSGSISMEIYFVTYGCSPAPE
ncbi:hypothetical protein [Streptosporangium sp. NBC_01756]|uniref:hypothetical protein n=1 Tax=Streptosporangium sp. NBC_01756 TaxID=2975950 RepID=UPI002DD914E3|nr:hypothetical protein [Streptosporangium sp. NBC_01756]WSC88565.1 hypothetical protein OIE48_10360 [Streptosporangium sp. NBC_01756]